MGLERIGAAIAAGAAEAVERLCTETAENAKALCPVESGELKGSIAARVSEGTGSVTAGAGHAAYVEHVKSEARFGRDELGKQGRNPARH